MREAVIVSPIRRARRLLCMVQQGIPTYGNGN